jgi:hypothetical protein
MSSQGWAQTLITAQQPGAAVTAAAATSLLPAQAKFTLSANFLSVIGQQLLIKASGKFSSVITTPGTARFDVRLGGTVMFDGLAVLLDSAAAHSNKPWDLEILLTAQVVGSVGQLMGIGKFMCEAVAGSGTMPLGSLVAMLPWNSTPALSGNTVDMTAAQQVDLFFTQTVTTGSITLQQYSLISLN